MFSPAKQIAILASADLLPGHPDRRADFFELEEEIIKLTAAFSDHGMNTELLDWRDAPGCATEFDAMLPLLCWDYFTGNEEAFFKAMAEIDQKTNLFNSFSVLKWNAKKDYLDELAAKGAPTIPTITYDRLSEARIHRAMDELRCDKVVIKPDIGGGAWRQAVAERGQALPPAEELPPHGALIQPYLTAVETEGEYSFLYFGGRFSHALQKKPKAGDYRVQSIHGGTETPYTPTRQERAQARAVLDVLDYVPLYARVDLIRGNEKNGETGHLLLIELEMIEPYLYLPYAPGEGGENKGAQRLAKALAQKLSS